ncbi:MAG: PGF-pre-PGF domain-containing protein [Candidatus Syntropharchaeia archaeon]
MMKHDKLYCYDANTGDELWNFTANGPIWSSPVVANNTVYFGTNVQNGTIYAINATDGALVWSYALNPPPGYYYNIMSSPAVSDGILFIGADDGMVRAFSISPVPRLQISIDKTEVNVSEEFTITVTANGSGVSGARVISGSDLLGFTNVTGKLITSIDTTGTYHIHAERDGFAISDSITLIVRSESSTRWKGKVRIEGINETIWYGEVVLENSTIVDTDGHSHFIDHPTALDVVDAASKLGNFSYDVVNQTWGLFLSSISGEMYDPETWNGWMYRVDYHSPMVGAADFLLNETNPPTPPHKEVLWYYGSWTDKPLRITLDKANVKVNEQFIATVESYNDTTGSWNPIGNATVYVGSSNYTTDINGNAVISISNAGSYIIYAEKGGCIRSEKKTVTVASTGGGDGATGTSYWWSGEVILPSGSFTRTAFDTGKEYTINWRTALGALQKASEVGGFSYEIEETDWGPFVYSIDGKKKGDEGPTSGWMYQVNGEIPMIGAYEYGVGIGDEVIWYFSKDMSTTPDTSSMVLRIRIGDSMSSDTSSTQGEEEEILPSGFSIEAGENLSLNFSGTIKELVIYANTSIENAMVEIEGIEAPEEGKELSGIVYAYLNITARNITDENIDNATIRFCINRNWIDKNNINVSTIRLNRYHAGNWTELLTHLMNQTNDLVYFEAITPGFSLFAITGEEKEVQETPTPVPTETPQAKVTPIVKATPTPVPSPPSEPMRKQPISWRIVGFVIVALVFLIMGISFYRSRTRRRLI